MNNNFTSKEFMEKVSDIVEANLHNEQFGVAELADKMGMSRSNLHRKVRKAAKVSVNQYIRQARLKYALQLLKTSSDNVSEVAYKSGFNSTAYFIKCFHDFYGYTPGESGSREQEAEPGESNSLTKRQRKFSLLWILSIAAFIVIVLTVINLSNISLSGSNKHNDDISIAVLPFIDDSPEEGNTYIVNGLMDEILNKLQNISVLKVKSRTDSEKYRDTKKSIAEIGRELKVNYILEGSGQVIDDVIKLRLQLIEASTGNHIWSKPYMEDTKDIFKLQEDVAFSVASELKANLTPEEEQQVEKRPTENLVAYYLYLRGNEFLDLASYATGGIDEKTNLIKQAKQLFYRAIKLDSTFSQAYYRLAHIYIERNFGSQMPDELVAKKLDSGLVMANIALQYDEKNYGAINMRGKYYAHKGDMEKARKEFAKADRYSGIDNWEEWRIYNRNFWKYFSLGDDYKALENFYKYSEIKPDDIINAYDFYYAVFTRFLNSGYPETAKEYHEKMLAIEGDTKSYGLIIGYTELVSGNYKTALNNGLKSLKTVSDSSTIKLQLLNLISGSYFYSRNFENSLEYRTKRAELSSQDLDSIANGIVGYLYLKTGNDEKANYHFQKRIKQIQEELKSNDSGINNFDSYFDLSCIFSALNEKEKALKHLNFLKNRQMVNFWQIHDLKNNPMLDNIRNEPEFIQILKDQEKKFLIVHNKVGELIRKYEK